MAFQPSKPLRRVDPRSEVAAIEIHGIAAKHQGRVQTPFILWDLSDRGLRLWMPERAQVGDILTLTIAKPFVVTMHAEVRWCTETEDQNGFQVGLKGLDNIQRLEELHAQVAKTLFKAKGSSAA